MTRPFSELVGALQSGRLKPEAVFLHIARRRWHVPMEGSRPYVDAGPGGEPFVVAISRPELLAPTEVHRAFHGFELAALARERGAGLAFDVNQPHAVNLLVAQLDALAPASAVADLEHRVLAPSPGEAERFRDATWYTYAVDGRPQTLALSEGVALPLFTTPEVAGWTAAARRVTAPIARMSGREIFARVGPDTVDGVAFHAGQDHQVLVGRDFLAATAAGRDLRPGAVDVHVRTAAEWDALVRQLDATQLESALEDDRARRYTLERRGHAFTVRCVPAPSEDTASFGPGTSSVLCAGFLRSEASLASLAAAVVGGADRRVHRALAAVAELEAQREAFGAIDAGRMRTLAGFAALRLRPERFERASLAELRATLEALPASAS